MASLTVLPMAVAGGLIRLALTSNALVGGFYLTRFIGIHLVGILPPSAIDDRMMYFKLAYIMLSYYLSFALTAILVVS